VSGEEFVRGFLQHVLPSGFRKVRYQGWLASNSKHRELVKWLVWLCLGWTFWLGSGVAGPPQQARKKTVCCAECGEPMRITRVTHGDATSMVERSMQTAKQRRKTLRQHKFPYLDSG
jgi:hypothetical protein